MEKIIRQFVGHSGSDIFLVQTDDSVFVRKTKNIERNYERLTCLKSNDILVPSIYEKHEDVLDMQYIDGTGVFAYLQNNGTDDLLKFLKDTITKFKADNVYRHYTSVYEAHLVVPAHLPFTKQQLISKLPKIVPQSLYHGDFTFDNIIVSDNKFYLIDGITTVYDSWVFDLAKLRQDTSCGWFMRNNPRSDIVVKKIATINKELAATFPELSDDYTLIAMLLRVLNYTKPNTKDYKFLIGKIKSLWK